MWRCEWIWQTYCWVMMTSFAWGLVTTILWCSCWDCSFDSACICPQAETERETSAITTAGATAVVVRARRPTRTGSPRGGAAGVGSGVRCPQRGGAGG